MEEILVVEDCPINRFFLEKGLSSKGFSVSTAGNGQEALEWLDKNAAAVVLMDIQMPVLDGLQATRRIRENENGKRLPIIAVTACASERERERCLQAGMDDVLSKPVVLAELCDLVRRLAGNGNCRKHACLESEKA